MQKLGTDTSFYVGQIDYNKMKSAGAEFTFIRAGQGGWDDDMFKENQSKSRGILPRGSYWFFDDRYSPSSQAEMYIDTVGDDLMELPLVVDYERSYGGNYSGWKNLLLMISKLEELVPHKKIMIYTRYYYWKVNSPPAGSSESEQFKKYPLWVAAYNDNPIEEQLVPEPWDELLIWQFGDLPRGQEFGVSSGNVDLNYFYGTDLEWDEFVGSEGEEEPPIDVNTEIKYSGVVISEYGVNFRSGAGTEYPTISAPKSQGTLFISDRIVVLGDEEWTHVIFIDGEDSDGWMASYWNGMELLTLTEIIPEPEPIYLEHLMGQYEDKEIEFEIRFWSNITAELSDGSEVSFQVSPDAQPIAEPVYWQLYTKVDLGIGDKFVSVVSRTPDTQEANKIQLPLMSGSTVYEIPIPKYRNHDGNLVPNYETEADRLNLQRDYAWLPEQSVLKSNGNTRMLPLDFDPSGNPWDGCYIERNYLKEVSSEIPPEPELFYGKVVEVSGVNLRTGAGSEYDKIDAIPFGVEIVADEIISVGDDEWAHIFTLDGEIVDGWMAVYWNGLILIEWIDSDYNVPPDVPVPDPNPPEKLYYARHGGYSRIPVYQNANNSDVVYKAEYSAIFIGDRLDGKYLHVTLVNGDITDGWIDITASEMIYSRIPDNVLNSPIPQKTKNPEIQRYVTVPESGEFMHIPHMNTKDYKTTQPDTVVLWKDNLNHPGWVQTTPELQWFFFDLLKLDAPGMPIEYYVMAYAYHYADNRFWTDLKDKDGHRDDILGLNPSAECYWVKWSITTRGNIVEVTYKNGDDVMLGGIDLSKPLPLAKDVYNDPRYVHCATQQSPEILSNGRPKVTHQPAIKQVVDGKMEKTRTSFPKIASPHPVSVIATGMEWVDNGKECPVVNLSRWL